MIDILSRPVICLYQTWNTKFTNVFAIHKKINATHELSIMLKHRFQNFQEKVRKFFSACEKKTQIYLAAKRARVLAVLGDFHLFDHFPQGGTVTGTIFAGDSNLLRALGLSKFKQFHHHMYTDLRNPDVSVHSTSSLSRNITSRIRLGYNYVRKSRHFATKYTC